jgi:hypothetical protein
MEIICKINELETNNKNKNIRDLYRGINEINKGYQPRKPVSMAERSKASTVFGRSNIGIAGSNPVQSMDVCLRLSVLCCPV